MTTPQFPITRLRRLRYNPQIRELFAETILSVNDLAMPLFVTFGENVKQEIHSMPGQFRYSIDLLVEKCRVLWEKQIKAVLLFGIPEHKDETGEVACRDSGIVQQAIKAIKRQNSGNADYR